MMSHYSDECNEIKTQQLSWSKSCVYRLWRYKLADFFEALVHEVFTKLNHSFTEVNGSLW